MKESTIDLIALSKGNTQAFDCLGLYQNVNNAVALLVGGEVCPPEKTCSVYYSQGRDRWFGQANPAPTVDDWIVRFRFDTSFYTHLKPNT